MCIGVVDTDETFGGLKGVNHLRENGVEVVCGVAKAACLKSLKPYLYHRQYKLPYCVCKVACSMDGKIACSDATSKWITQSEARSDSHLTLR